jgi:transcriptional regulator with PAS, ATPase and Fis domain
LPLILQAKILRILENKTFRRVGGGKYIETDVRIVAATNRDLKKLVQKERFRDDLFYRLNVVPMHLPPLRDRREDIFPLIEYFVHSYNKKIGRNIKNVSNEALKLLIEYDWPGNIRELKNVVEHMAIITKGNVISAENLPNEIRFSGKGGGYAAFRFLPENSPKSLPDFRNAKKTLIEEFEKGYLTTLLAKNEWSVSKCARDIKMHRSSFQRLMNRYGLKK